MACVVSSCVDVYIFFFQAEDGKRDGRVTGVQTCALPISSIALSARLLELLARLPQPHDARDLLLGLGLPADVLHPHAPAGRSEERRAGRRGSGGERTK